MNPAPSSPAGIAAPSANAFARAAASPLFQNSALALIAFNALFVGLETSREIVERAPAAFRAAGLLIQVLFVAEIAVRLLACGRRPHAFFRDGWNVFDFAVVACSLLPSAGPFATVARLARLLRALRLVSAVPELRLIVSTMLRSLPSLVHVVFLLSLILYVYAVLGVNLFGPINPEAWGGLGRAGLTLFQILTLEGWIELQNEAVAVHPWAWIYFVSFVVLAGFVVVNLFIAVVINNLEKVRDELDPKAVPADASGAELTAGILAGEVRELSARIRSLEAVLTRAGANPPAGDGAEAGPKG